MSWISKLVNLVRSDTTKYQSNASLWGDLVAQEELSKTSGTGHTLDMMRKCRAVVQDMDDAVFYVTYSIAAGPARNEVIHVPYASSTHVSDFEIILGHTVGMMALHHGAYVLHNWWRIPNTEFALKTADNADTLIKAGLRFNRLRNA